MQVARKRCRREAGQSTESDTLDAAFGLLLLCPDNEDVAVSYATKHGIPAEDAKRVLRQRFTETPVQSLVDNEQALLLSGAARALKIRQYLADYQVAKWVRTQIVESGRALGFQEVFQAWHSTQLINANVKPPQSKSGKNQRQWVRRFRRRYGGVVGTIRTKAVDSKENLKKQAAGHHVQDYLFSSFFLIFAQLFLSKIMLLAPVFGTHFEAGIRPQK